MNPAEQMAEALRRWIESMESDANALGVDVTGWSDYNMATKALTAWDSGDWVAVRRDRLGGIIELAEDEGPAVRPPLTVMEYLTGEDE